VLVVQQKDIYTINIQQHRVGEDLEQGTGRRATLALTSTSSRMGSSSATGAVAATTVGGGGGGGGGEMESSRDGGGLVSWGNELDGDRGTWLGLRLMSLGRGLKSL
jgi:hypothetical protein